MVASALLTAMVVNAVVIGQQAATVTPTAVSPLPVTLTAGTATTVTASTVAVTSGLTPPLSPLPAATTLTLARQAPNDWSVTLVVTSASGITTVITSEQLQIVFGGQTLSLDPGDTYPQSMPAVTLGAAGRTVTLGTTALAGCHTCSVTAELRITPTTSSLPLFVYPYTITTAA